ncbi:MAG: hypothetical protein KC912_26790 [Proteobacteria bacterium]|nr:hypothetical protein [Pseudomonadota bacterium]
MRAVSILLLLSACSGEGIGGLDVLGGGLNTLDSVQVEVLATSADGLNSPSDVSINPRTPGEIWITNFADNSIIRMNGDTLVGKFGAPGSEHFLASPSALAFSDFGNFATAQDTDEVTQSFTPADFMGPTLWDDSDQFDGGHAGHLDMLHNSPNGGGIAWESDNIYWYFDGAHSSLTRYDFADDHGYGGSDHSDGIIDRYAEGLVRHNKGTPSHMDYVDGIIYVADSGNQRIVSYDPTTATRQGLIGPDYDGVEMTGHVGGDMFEMSIGSLAPVLDENGRETVAPTSLGVPSGLEVVEGIIYVSDFGTGNILALSLDGELIDWVPTGRVNALAGLDVDENGNILVIDMVSHELLRISPL